MLFQRITAFCSYCRLYVQFLSPQGCSYLLCAAPVSEFVNSCLWCFYRVLLHLIFDILILFALYSDHCVFLLGVHRYIQLSSNVPYVQISSVLYFAMACCHSIVPYYGIINNSIRSFHLVFTSNFVDWILDSNIVASIILFCSYLAAALAAPPSLFQLQPLLALHCSSSFSRGAT